MTFLLPDGLEMNKASKKKKGFRIRNTDLFIGTGRSVSFVLGRWEGIKTKPWSHYLFDSIVLDRMR